MPSLAVSPTSAPSALPLYVLASVLQEVIEDNFAGMHLLTAEIASLSDSNARGHCYLELIDKNPTTGEEVRLRATIWANRWRVVAHYFLQETGQKLAKGMQVLLEAELVFHPAYGLSLNIQSVDAGYTLGRQKQQLEKILARLTQEGLLELQKNLTPEPVWQRIAVISSPSAAGYQDFVHQLEGNTYQYAFEQTLFTAIMQGENTEASLLNALGAIAKRVGDFDAVAIIRGGGADQDLVAFNSYELGKALATFPLPILTGIGHERDTTVPDLVAYQRLKTPTAVAEHLIERVALFEGELDDVVETTEHLTRTILLSEQTILARLENGLIGTVASYLPNQNSLLSSITERITAAAVRGIDVQQYGLASLQKQLHLLNPRVQLKRGFALVYTEKGLAKKAKNIKGNIRIVLADGEANGSFIPR